MSEPLDYGEECIIPLLEGGSIRTPAFPEECDYVRVCNDDAEEVGYWTWEEWQEDPQVVMGAIIGCAKWPVAIPGREGA